MSTQQCSNCYVKSTPTWRKAEGMPVCNKCGMYYNRHKKQREVSQEEKILNSNKQLEDSVTHAENSESTTKPETISSNTSTIKGGRIRKRTTKRKKVISADDDISRHFTFTSDLKAEPESFYFEKNLKKNDTMVIFSKKIFINYARMIAEETSSK
ncbi:hypothetical protein AKO1_007754 [Acrasis kona]|uniref:GATA-type domain-containing protein n=1 Tax=Acrasis kona TaxID=1008807 RepID=A0AAW2YQU2_9EUKA